MILKQEKIFITLAVVLIFVGIYLEKIQYKIYLFFPPISWGIAKDILDPIFILIFPWNGYIVFFPAIFAFYFRLKLKFITFLWILSSIVVGLVDTFFSFSTVSPSRLAKGVFFYGCIFGLASSLAFILTIIFRRNKNGISD